MSGYTKGPWLQDDVKIEDETGGLVALVYSRNGGSLQSNARLISAAPDLVEALLDARRFIANGIELGFICMPDASTPDPAHNTLPTIEAALKKAGIEI